MNSTEQGVGSVTKIYTNNWNLGFEESTVNIPLIQGQDAGMGLLNIDSDPFLELILRAYLGGGISQTAIYDNGGYLENAEKGLNNFKLYPNPNNGDFQLQFSYVNPDVKMIICNTSGDVVHSQNVMESNTSISLDVSSGLYMVTILSSDRIQNEKISIGN